VGNQEKLCRLDEFLRRSNKKTLSGNAELFLNAGLRYRASLDKLTQLHVTYLEGWMECSCSAKNCKKAVRSSAPVRFFIIYTI
jgi:hypothetical protein